MIAILVGLVLLFFPLSLVLRFKDKRYGFAYLLMILLSFHFVSAVLTQLFHIFNYWVVFGINLLFVFICFVVGDIGTYFRQIDVKKINLRKIDWVLVFVIIISFLSLFFVHYNYSGDYSNLATPVYQHVEKLSYVYPYFVDEWYSISLIKYSIDSNSLPFEHSLIKGNKPLTNLNFPFHSFLSEIVVLLDLNPITSYVYFSIFFNLLLCVLVYLFLKFNNMGKLSSSIASLSILYLTNGANLPGLWTFIPLTMGILIMLCGFFFLVRRDNRMILLTSALLFLFYAPLLPFYLIAFVVLKRYERFRFKDYFYVFLVVFSSIVFMTFLFYLVKLSHVNLLLFISRAFNIYSQHVFYNSFTNFTPRFSLINVIPLLIIFLSFFGLLPLWKKHKWFLFVLCLGFFYWLIYSFFPYRFLIDYERVVVFTSILTVIVSGFGLDVFERYLIKNSFLKNGKIYGLAVLFILIIFFLLSFSYSSRDNWKQLVAVDSNTGRVVYPASPVNTYLVEEDLKIFENIKGENFLSHPWKGVVIGVTTGNYPLSTKPGTVTLNPNLYGDFLISDCGGKENIVKEYKISYVYAQTEISCNSFVFINRSSEGFYLYEFK